VHIPDVLNYAGSIFQDGALADRHQVVFLAELVKRDIESRFTRHTLYLSVYSSS